MRYNNIIHKHYYRTTVNPLIMAHLFHFVTGGFQLFTGTVHYKMVTYSEYNSAKKADWEG